jgi:hypothetical protein
MDRFNGDRLRIWRLTRWQTGLLAALAIALGLAIAGVATVLVVIITPIFLAIALALKYFGKPAQRRGGGFAPRGKVIDVDYEIVAVENDVERDSSIREFKKTGTHND